MQLSLTGQISPMPWLASCSAPALLPVPKSGMADAKFTFHQTAAGFSCRLPASFAIIRALHAGLEPHCVMLGWSLTASASQQYSVTKEQPARSGQFSSTKHTTSMISTHFAKLEINSHHKGDGGRSAECLVGNTGIENQITSSFLGPFICTNLDTAVILEHCLCVSDRLIVFFYKLNGFVLNDLANPLQMQPLARCRSNLTGHILNLLKDGPVKPPQAMLAVGI